MEWTLHRQLKERFADDPAAREVRLGPYRIDAMKGKTLVEIQSSPLASIRAKIAVLVKRHTVLLVKPIPHRTTLVTQWPDRPEPTRRKSPTVGTWHHLFLEMVHLRGVFPHPRLTLEVLLVNLEEHRQREADPTTRRRKGRRRHPPKPHRVLDRQLVEILGTRTLRTAADLEIFLPQGLPQQFTTQQLAELSEIPRWLAQKMAYSLRHCGTIEMAGKIGNSILYQRACAGSHAA